MIQVAIEAVDVFTGETVVVSFWDGCTDRLPSVAVVESVLSQLQVRANTLYKYVSHKQIG